MDTTVAVQSNLPDLAKSRHGYARETRQRMDRMIVDLRAVEQGDVSNIDCVLEALRAQEEAGRLTGFRGIVRLCRDLRDCLTEARNDEPSRLAAVAATLSEICRTVQLHADTVGNTLTRRAGEDEPLRTNVKDTAHCMPPAPVLGRIVEQKGETHGENPRR